MKIKLAALAVTLASAAAFAQQSQPDQGNDPFVQLDVDQSSGISTQEAQASPVVSEAFTRADANADGILTREEFYGAFQVQQQPQDAQPQSAPSEPTPPSPQPE